MARYVIAAVAGAIIAWVAMAFVLYAMFTAGGYTREALVEPPPWVFFSVGGGGALTGLVVAVLGRRTALPTWVRPVALGALAGVAVVVFAAEFVSSFADGPKGPGKYRHAVLVYGVPIGLVVGAVAGFLRLRRKTATVS
jgi:hypothetical protein